MDFFFYFPARVLFLIHARIKDSYLHALSFTDRARSLAIDCGDDHDFCGDATRDFRS
jgi:hypothetical protein